MKTGLRQSHHLRKKSRNSGFDDSKSGLTDRPQIQENLDISDGRIHSGSLSERETYMIKGCGSGGNP
jgi:hypothetical protein